MRLVMLALLAFLFSHADAAADTARPRSVLILDQSTKNAPWSVALQSALSSKLNSEPGLPIAIYFEHLDFGLFDGPRYEDDLRAFLGAKYRNVRVGAIIALGAKALTFTEGARSALWSDVPIIFAGVDAVDAARLQGSPGVTGTIMELPLANLVAAARLAKPDFARLVIVGDPFDRQPFRGHFKEAMATLSKELDVVDLTGLPMDELKKRVAALSNDSIIAYTNIYSDGKGLVYTPRDALAVLAQSANRPIVVDVETFIGVGSVGGFAVTPRPVGEEAARIALRVLAGEPPESIPVTVGDFQRPIFDWKQLQHWNISADRLPAASEIRFRNPTAWEQYGTQIVLIAMALAIQTLLIGGLFYERGRRRRAEQRIRLDMSALANMNRRVVAGEISASIAHEIRQPVAAITTNAGAGLRWLKSNPPAIDKARASLEMIADDSHRTGLVIEAIRSAFKKGTDARAQIDINELVQDTLALHEADLRAQQIRVQLNLATDGPSVWGDRNQIQQVLLNLITNAAHAMSGVPDRHRMIRISTQKEDERIKLSVEDSGPGISKDTIEKIFDPFFTTSPEGMGMGLAICQSIVQSHDGSIWAEASPLGGASFHVVLPEKDQDHEP